jgi:hypothetical protein
MTMPGLYSEIYAEAELNYRRELMLAGASRMHRRAYPFHWRRRKSEPQPTRRDGGPATQPVRRPAAASGAPCG